jgi:hypothetical protein
VDAPGHLEVNEAFDRDYDMPEYEAKIGELSRRAHVRADGAGELDRWNEAVRVLGREDHYLLVLLPATGEASGLSVVDRLKIVGVIVSWSQD